MLNIVFTYKFITMHYTCSCVTYTIIIQKVMLADMRISLLLSPRDLYIFFLIFEQHNLTVDQHHRIIIMYICISNDEENVVNK